MALAAVLAAALFAAGCGTKSGGVPTEGRTPGSLEGTVFVDDYNGGLARSASAETTAPEGKRPLAGATVALSSGTTTTTNANGYFFLSNLAGGSYTLTIAHPNFATATLSVTVTAGATTNLNETESADEMTMAPPSDEVGALVVSAFASATIPTPVTMTVYINGESTGKQTSPTAVFDNLAAGATYTVSVQATGYQTPAPQEAHITAGQTTTVTFGIETTTGNFSPAATIVTPVENQRFQQGSPVTFTGTGLDSEDGNLSGTSLAWSSSVDGALGTGGLLQKSNLSAATHTITLTVTDSAGSTAADTVVIAVVATTENHAPTATIFTPTSGTAYTAGQTVLFTGAGTDQEQGGLTGTSLTWTSSRDGALGTGSLLSLTDLTVGTHTITLTAQDSTGLSGSATITVTINAATGATGPTAAIATPAQDAEYTVGQTVVITGSATDNEDGVLTGTSLEWTSSRDGALGTGPLLTKSNLTVGGHVITLTAEDSAGNTDTATVSITINAAGANQAPTAAIATPTAGAAYTSGRYILFTGAATDPEDGAVAVGSLDWSSSLDGSLGAGATLLLNTLADGTHVITLTATDSDGLSDTATVTITVE